MVDRAKRLNTTIGFWSMAIGFPIALIIFAFSGCNLRKRADKRACKAGSVDKCLEVGQYYDAKRGGIIAFLMSYADDATVYYLEACKLSSPDGCEHMLDVYEHGEQAKNLSVDTTAIADALIEACVADLAKGCTELESFAGVGDWVLVRSSEAFKRHCDAGSAQACYMLAGMDMKELAGLHNTAADVLPKLDKACASKLKDSCELARVYREGMAGAGPGSASP
jgi:TPR repeat protein